MFNKGFQDIKLNQLRLIVIFLVFSQLGFAQSVSTLGLELGITFSQFPKREFQNMANTKITDNPLPGPLIGISKKWVLSKHFYFSSGFQYQMAGKRYHVYEKASNYLYSDNLTIHKICIPLDLEFRFKIGKFKPSFYLGVKPNMLLSAKEYHTYPSSDGSKYEEMENLFHKINGVDDYKPPKRLLVQFSTGFSCSAGQHLRINVNFNYGTNYYVTTSWYQGNYSHYPVTLKTSIPSSDYIISAVYYFNKSERNNANSKNE
jgi:hypothetical protein